MIPQDGSGIVGNGTSEGSQQGGSQSGSSSAGGLSAREAARFRWTNSFPSPAPVLAGNSRQSQSVAGHELSSAVEESDKTAACPVCGVPMAMATINAHLDRCLVQDGARGTSTPLASSQCGDSHSRDRGESLTVSDTDDDEPLVKRRGIDNSTEQVHH